ncbi:MAG: hypothetical protein ACSHYA_00570 [Opitutaceae bacterium]
MAKWCYTFNRRVIRLSILLVALLALGCAKDRERAFDVLILSNSWEPINASPFGVGKGTEWALMLTDGSWRTLVITTYTPWEKEGKEASIYLSSSFNSDGREEIKHNSPEEGKLIEALELLNYQEHQEVFKPIVNEYLETLSDRTNFVYEPQEMEIESADGINE